MVLRKSFPKFREAKIKGSSEKDIIKPPGTHKKQIELNSSSRQTDVFLLMIAEFSSNCFSSQQPPQAGDVRTVSYRVPTKNSRSDDPSHDT
jgi:hypothetical protein